MKGGGGDGVYVTLGRLRGNFGFPWEKVREGEFTF